MSTNDKEPNTNDKDYLRDVRKFESVWRRAKTEKKALEKRIDELCSENEKLRKLVNGLTWCCEHHGCDNRCPLYDRSEPDHCRENLLKQALGIDVK